MEWEPVCWSNSSGSLRHLQEKADKLRTLWWSLGRHRFQRSCLQTSNIDITLRWQFDFFTLYFVGIRTISIVHFYPVEWFLCFEYLSRSCRIETSAEELCVRIAVRQFHFATYWVSGFVNENLVIWYSPKVTPQVTTPIRGHGCTHNANSIQR